MAAGLGAAALAHQMLTGSATPALLALDSERLGRLRALRAEPKFIDAPGALGAEELRRLEPLINELLDRLIAGLGDHPNEAWVLAQMEPTVEAFHLEDTEARERCLHYIDAMFRILGMPDDRGAFRKYMIFW